MGAATSTFTSPSGCPPDAVRALHRRILFGALAAGCTAVIGLDASLFAPSEYPLAHKLFDGDWVIGRNSAMMLASIGAAFFGYLGLNVKDDA